ncbi:MAG TPA: hypothetical protein VHB79_10910 [Polyangiaceae bacterium]|nr:hypothetical protein [Polyangiaceae bacterium]
MVAVAFPVALSLFALGCPQPGDLENANAYPPPPGGNTAGSGGSGTGGSGTMVNCETACLASIINATGTGCKTCHSDMVKLDMGILDMASPGLSARLKDEASQHKGITGDTSGCPMGDKIIDSANPANSWLLKKITGQQGTCGTVMPSTGALSAADQKCVSDFVYCVAGGTAPAGSGGTAAGGGGSGGAATGGGGSGGAAAGSSGSATGGGGGTGGT